MYKKLKVLIIDRNSQFQEFLKISLWEVGFSEVNIFGMKNERKIMVIPKTDSRPFDLLIISLELVGVSGIFLLSSTNTAGTMLFKPFNKEDLKNVIDGLVS